MDQGRANVNINCPFPPDRDFGFRWHRTARFRGAARGSRVDECRRGRLVRVPSALQVRQASPGSPPKAVDRSGRRDRQVRRRVSATSSASPWNRARFPPGTISRSNPLRFYKLRTKPLCTTFAKTANREFFGRDVARFGFIDEWHLDFGKAFRHFAFEFLAWFRQPREMVATAFFRSWFEAIGTIGHLVSGYGM